MTSTARLERPRSSAASRCQQRSFGSYRQHLIITEMIRSSSGMLSSSERLCDGGAPIAQRIRGIALFVWLSYFRFFTNCRLHAGWECALQWMDSPGKCTHCTDTERAGNHISFNKLQCEQVRWTESSARFSQIQFFVLVLSSERNDERFGSEWTQGTLARRSGRYVRTHQSFNGSPNQPVSRPIGQQKHTQIVNHPHSS
jgi:hypothetical protein